MSGRQLLSLSLAMALVQSITSPVRAELLKNFKTDGSIEVRSFGIDNEVDLDGATDDYRSETRTRVMVGGNFDLLDDVHSRVLLRKNNRVYGGTGGTSEDLNTVQSNIRVDNANVKIDKVFGRVDLTMGRQFYGDNQDLVIYFGPQNDDVLSVTALDIFRADAMLGDWARIQGIAGKLADTGATGAGANSDSDLWGAEIGTEKLIPMGSLAAYYYTDKVKNSASTLGNNTLVVTGVRAMGDIIAGLGYHAEFIKNFGRNKSVAPAAGTSDAYTGNAHFLNLHYGRELDGRPIRARLEYGRGTDNFQAVAPGRRFGIIWGEHTSVGPSTLNRSAQSGAGLSNLVVYDAGLGISPIAKFGIDVYAYRFMYDAVQAGVNGRSAGTEYDLVFSWKHSDNVSLEANAATFQVGEALENTGTGTSPITRIGADIKVKF